MDVHSSFTDSQTDTAEYKFNTVSQNYCSADEPTDGSGHLPLQQNIPPTYSGVLQDSPSQIIIVGTAHVSEKSVRQVVETIEREHPDIVAVELCRGRYDALKGKAQVSQIPIKELLSEGKVYFFLVHWLLAYIQKKIGDEMGVQPGAEMINAIDAAEASGAKVALIDRDIQVTLQRFWSKMGFFEKIRMVSALIGAALGFGDGKDIDIDNITDQDMVTMLIEELRGIAPTAATVLIDERDAYIAGNLVRAASGGGKKIVAVVGAGHRSGIENYLKHPETIPPLGTLMDVPKKRFSMMKLIGIGIVGIAIATFALLILSGTPLKLLLLAFGWWFIINGTLSAAGAIIARGHPYSVITAFMVAWLTSLNPMMAAGWFAGLVEAKQRNPTTDDFKKLMEVETTGSMLENNLFRVILVAALANIGSMIGTFLGVYVMMQVAGVDPRDVISAGL
ncbi:MAG: TraB/GumN family protein, partial [Methanosarcinaceae archaeon]|nr:TraB/GumN family protein [Methanosarcinaceae archaeon]